MKRTLYDIVDGWTLIFNRGIVEITLNQISDFFYKQKVMFLLMEDLWDILERFDDPTEFMTEERMMLLIEQLLRDHQNEQVAKFVELEITEPPEYNITVTNVNETISQFPSFFKEYDGMTWDDFTSSLFDK